MPTISEALQLAIAHHQAGRLAAAEQIYREILRAEPNQADALHLLGVVAHQAGHDATAVEHIRAAIRIAPRIADYHGNLGVACAALGQLDEALACYRQALALKPGHAAAHANLGDALAQQGMPAEAIDSYERSLQSDPNPIIRYRKATCLPVIYRSLDELRGARRQLQENLDELYRDGVRFDPRRDVLSTVFHLAYQGEDDREIHARIARLWRPEPARLPPRSGGRAGAGKIRVGFVSQFFHRHTIGLLWQGLIARLSRQKFTVTVFPLGQADDPVADRIRAAADHWCPLPLEAAAARQAIAARELDVLCYPDIGMAPLAYTLAQSRLAPVQCVAWGHPVTSGAPAIDYFLSSELLESADADSHYTEKLVRLKTLGLYVDRPQLPPPPKSRGDFGLPAGAHLYACLQSLFKFHPAYDGLLAEILRRDPQGLLLLPTGACPHWQELLRQRLAREIPDVAERIRWMPLLSYDDFLRLNAVVDVLLIPPLFSGGKTSYDALALGVPLVTLPSSQLRGRITYGMYRAMDVDDCIAHTPLQYVDLAVRLADDGDYRQAVREKILAASGRLFEDLEAVRELERFFQWAVKQA